MEYLWLIVGWVIYFALHSILAIRQLKSLARSKGVSDQTYRLLYNLIGLITLIPIFFLSNQIPEQYVLERTGALKYAGLMLAAAGVIIARKSFKVFDTKMFLGLKPMKKEAFRTDGLLKYVRHPMYSASILILAGYFLYDPIGGTLVSVVMIITYFVVGSHFEERKLIREYGDKYLEYKKKTPRLVPRLWNRS